MAYSEIIKSLHKIKEKKPGWIACTCIITIQWRGIKILQFAIMESVQTKGMIKAI